MKTHARIALGAAALFAANAANAVIVLGNGDTVNLGVLMANGSDRKFIVNDKLFTVESINTSVFHLDDFTVMGFISQNANQYGLKNTGFDLTGPFGTAARATATSTR